MSNLITRLFAFCRGELGALMRSPEGRQWALEACLWEAGDAMEEERRALEALGSQLEGVRETRLRLEPRVRSLETDVDRALAAGAGEIAEVLMSRLLPMAHTLRGLEDAEGALEVRLQAHAARVARQDAELALLRGKIRGGLGGVGRRGDGEVGWPEGGSPSAAEVRWALRARQEEMP